MAKASPVTQLPREGKCGDGPVPITGEQTQGQMP